MRKKICILLTLSLLFSLYGCANISVPEQNALAIEEPTETVRETQAETTPATESPTEETVPPTEPEVVVPAQEIDDGFMLLVDELPQFDVCDRWEYQQLQNTTC